jgi:N-acetylgalactosamine-6-sulfatase
MIEEVTMRNLMIAALACLTLLTPIAAAADKPNIVFILVDDMGYGDIGCYGRKDVKTPHIDKLASQGVKFTQFYSNGAECSPTRTAFLTGRHPQRAGGLECAIGTGNVGRYDDAIRLADQRQLGLPAEQTVIPQQLKAAGYASGGYGKWHLGYEPQFNAMRHGWDAFNGFLGGNVDYYTHRETSDLHVLYRDELPVHREGYSSHWITDDAISFIDEHKDGPFFLYVPHATPHFPYQTPQNPGKVVTEATWKDGTDAEYVQMLEDMDDSVGKILATIDKHGLADNTIVIYASDNGGITPLANHAGLRGMKSRLFEGGIRVPLIIRWPGHIKPNTVCDQVSVTMDLTKSILNLAGAKAKPGRPLDGYDIIDHVARDKGTFERTMFWRARRGDRTWKAVRDGDMKYIWWTEEGKQGEYLFDLSNDIGEQSDLMGARPAMVKQLRKKLAAWEKDVKAER